jgi:Cupredoxin-like domain
MRLPRAFLLAAALGLVLLGAATAGVMTRTGAAKSTITVTEREYKISLSSKSAKKGLVRLVVRNAGKYAHALSIKGAGVSKRTPLIKPGKSAVLVVTLRSGRYALWCPVPGHAAQGMKATLSLAGAKGTTSTTTSSTDTNGTTTEPPPYPPGY